MANSVEAQNANERNIQLPVPTNSELPSLYLIGDSTVRNGSGDGANGQWGWGSVLSSYFDTDRVNVVNRALGGRSSRTYITQGYWSQQKELLKPGDVVLIQFGHNDASPINDTSRARGVLDGIGEEKKDIFNKLTKKVETVYTYGSYLRTYISDIKNKGATPIICSLVPTNGKVIDKEDQFAKWAEQVAVTEGVRFLDLNKIIAREYEKVGRDKVQDFFVDDNVHTTREGAEFSAEMVVATLKGLEQNPVEPWFSKKAETVEMRNKDTKEMNGPVVTGYGEGRFEVGELLYRDDFTNPDEWVPQVEETDAQTEPRIDFWNGFLEVVVPGRGATIWNRNKFSGNVAITYKVKAPSTYVEELGIVVRDINTFWHASDPNVPDDIFNPDKYTGAFSSYHKQQGYYASMGGRDNTTTRFRRYPRIRNGEPVEHIALSERDGRKKFLIRPDHTHTIQLVTYDDVIQYIVDGNVYYEIQEGDTVTVFRPDGTQEQVVYTPERFPSYNEGWFGFRLVNTHHIYSDFRVCRLESVE
ncbi:rhamnogalacturonan acetylesterase [Aliifodinibius salicampi]|uniref:Rhamnogalacturonan acetylesterase n=1 Tax=Fodinibius salicampi TaxID=1920655 RepID=A0ABT3PZI3_9BACT|nr:DUF6250 domain-containing protein [Fodinibius salicampi]MCW9713282.1 rhamnogalacturonan acetylesterase [Fodinibius salicampi]